MATNVRGGESEGQRVRTETNGNGNGEVGGSSDPFGGQSVSRQAPNAPAPTRSAASRALRLGRTAELPRELVVQAALKLYADTCRARNIPVPTDLDLLNRAHVVFVDLDDREVALDSVVITWDEGL